MDKNDREKGEEILKRLNQVRCALTQPSMY
jgi:hypothetical protein